MTADAETTAPGPIIGRVLRWPAVLTVSFVIVACSSAGSGSGTVIEVDGDLTSVTSFIVLTEDGDRLTLVPDPDATYEFALPHLRDHLQTGDPVAFEYEERDGRLVLTSIGDG